jgi:hypothetical protein
LRAAATAVKIIVVKLVPTALAGINSYNSVNTGTMNIPPPMPVNEATMAMRKPKIGSSHKSSIS